MKSIRALVALFLVAIFLVGTAHANTSSVNPNVPAQNSPLSSSVLRGNFANAKSDIDTIFAMLGLSSNQLLGTLNAGNAGPLNVPSCSTGALSWTPGSGFGCNSLSGLISPITVPLVFTGNIAFNLNSASLPTKQNGTVVQFGNSDAVPTRLENDAFGAATYFSGIRFDGTNASPTTLQSGDEIVGFNAWGYNGSSVVGPKGSFRVFTSQNWSNTANGTYADIATALNGTTSLNQVAKFENDGGITVPGTVTGGSKGAGWINVAGGIAVNGGPIPLTQGGTAAATTTGALSNILGNPTSGTYSIVCASAASCTTTAASAGGGGSGTVNSGTAGQIAFYSGTGTAVSGSSAAFLSTTGYLGVGTTNPTGVVTAVDGGTASGVVFAGSSANTIGTSFQLANSSSGGHTLQFFSGGSGAGSVGCMTIADNTANNSTFMNCGTSKVASVLQTGVFAWSTATQFIAPGYDLGLSRVSAGVLAVGNGNQGSTSGIIESSGYNIGAKVLISGAAPTVSSGFGTSPTIPSNNGPAAFTLNVGTGGTATSGVIGLPAATTGWICNANDKTSQDAITTACQGTSTTTATCKSYSRTTGSSTAWNASDILEVSCHAL